MTYFPLISIPFYQRQYASNVEIHEHQIIKNDQYDGSGWKKVESKACTIAILLISLVIGGALIGLGFSGLFVSAFHLHPGICISGIIFGSVLMIPPFVALKLGFKPNPISSKTEPSQLNNSTVANPNISKADQQVFRQSSSVRTQQRGTKKSNVEADEKAIEAQKQFYDKQVPQGRFAKFPLSNGNVYYVGYHSKKKNIFGTTEAKVAYELSPSLSLDQVKKYFPHLTFMQS